MLTVDDERLDAAEGFVVDELLDGKPSCGCGCGCGCCGACPFPSEPVAATAEVAAEVFGYAITLF